MDILSLATKSITIGDDIKQNNEDLQIDVEKLIGIANDLVYMTDDFIFGVYVSPMSLLQRKLSEVKDIKFHIVYNCEYNGARYSEAKEVCTGLIDEFCKDEFEGLSGISYVDYTTNMYQDESALLLYSVFGEFNINGVDDPEYILLWNLLQSTGYSISVPNTFPYEQRHSVMLHCPSYMDIPRMQAVIKTAEKSLNVNIVQEDMKSVRVKKFAYIPIVGMSRMNYRIPYTYIDKNSFSPQRLEYFLNNTQ